MSWLDCYCKGNPTDWFCMLLENNGSACEGAIRRSAFRAMVQREVSPPNETVTREGIFRYRPPSEFSSLNERLNALGHADPLLLLDLAELLSEHGLIAEARRLCDSAIRLTSVMSQALEDLKAHLDEDVNVIERNAPSALSSDSD